MTSQGSPREGMTQPCVVRAEGCNVPGNMTHISHGNIPRSLSMRQARAHTAAQILQ